MVSLIEEMIAKLTCQILTPHMYVVPVLQACCVNLSFGYHFSTSVCQSILYFSKRWLKFFHLTLLNLIMVLLFWKGTTPPDSDPYQIKLMYKQFISGKASLKFSQLLVQRHEFNKSHAGYYSFCKEVGQD